MITKAVTHSLVEESGTLIAVEQWMLWLVELKVTVTVTKRVDQVIQVESTVISHMIVVAIRHGGIGRLRKVLRIRTEV